MKEILYEDCNNNASFLKHLFTQIQKFSAIELNWSISNLEFIPIDKGDYIEGIPKKMEKVYNFQKKILDEHTVYIAHGTFIDLLEDIKTIYEGDFVALNIGKKAHIKVFDGDIIEIDFDEEDKLKF